MDAREEDHLSVLELRGGGSPIHGYKGGGSPIDARTKGRRVTYTWIQEEEDHLSE